MTVIVHISDTHFGTEMPEVVAAIKAAITSIKPDVVMLSGDITQRARPLQFRAAREFMDALPAATKLAVPGNHDIPLFAAFARVLLPYRHYRRAFQKREAVWSDADCCIVAFDATSRWRHTRGRLSAAQIRKGMEAARARMKPGQILIVCAHQPLQTAWEQDHEERLIGADATAQLLAEYGADMVLSGHVHVPLITTTHNHFPALPRHFVLAGAGTAISRRIRPGAPNQFNVIACEDGKMEVRSWEYDVGSMGFREVHAASFNRSENGWQL
jgi:3',5'-cyclic AMP phosphodiesterase CpdA